jgi:hypothetical protein
LLPNESRRQSFAQRGRERCLRAHTWVRRFERVEVLGVLAR